MYLKARDSTPFLLVADRGALSAELNRKSYHQFADGLQHSSDHQSCVDLTYKTQNHATGDGDRH